MAAGPNAPTEAAAGGYRISIASSQLSINAWGYWPPEVADAFTGEANAISRKLMLVSTFILDAAELKPQGAEGQQALRALFRVLAAMNLARGTFVANNMFTKMQLERLLRESGLGERVAAVD